MPGTDRALEALLKNVEPGSVVSQTVPVRAGAPAYYRYVRTNGARLAELTAQPAQWAHGVGLLGYHATRGAPLEVFLRVFREAEPGRNYHWFNHAYAGDERIAQADGGGIHPANWRAGDILLHWFELPVAPGTAPDRIRIGSYLYPEVQPVMVVDGAGNPIGDGVDLPLSDGGGS
jgi:hypothetical protein